LNIPRRIIIAAAAAALLCAGADCAFRIDTLPVVKITPGGAASLKLSDYIIPDSSQTVFKVRVLPRRRNDRVKVAYDPETGTLGMKAVKNFGGVEIVRIAVYAADASPKMDKLQDAALVIIAAKKKIVRFSYMLHDDAKKVSVAGDFNGWSQTATPLQPDEGVFTGSAEIPPGVYQYKLVVDGQWMSDPAVVESISDGFGGYNSVLRVEGEREYPGEFAGIARRKDEKTGQRRYVLRYAGRGRKNSLDITTLLVLMDNRLLTGREYDFDMSGERIIIRPPAQEGRHWFRVFACDRRGDAVMPFCFVDGRADGRDWEDSVFYSLMIDRFSDGDPSNDRPVNDPEVESAFNYQGGDFKGITDKIKSGYFEKLGINVIALSPVMDNPDAAYRLSSPPFKKSAGYHGLWPVSSTDTEKRFGAMEDLKGLVDAAHPKGLKVVLEVVLNDVHKENPLYREHAKWFSPLILPGGRKNLRLFGERPLDTWFEDFLPDFDYQKNPDAAEFAAENCAWWLEKTGADGIKINSSNYLHPSLFSELRKRLPGVYIGGDAAISREKTMEYVSPGALSGQYDFPLCWAIRDAFCGEGSFEKLDAERQKSEEEFLVPGVVISPLAGGADLQRFMSSSDHARLRMATAFLMTLPGAPAVYYGDEFGLAEGMPPWAHPKMKFDSELTQDEARTLRFFSAMTRVRREHPAARYGKHVNIALGGGIYVYLKQYFEDVVLVAMNISGEAKEVAVSLPEYLRGKRELTDIITPKKYLFKNGKLNLKIPPSGCMVLIG
jgi:glycosidase